MSLDAERGLVAGFADPASETCGAFWRLGTGVAGLLLSGGEVAEAEVKLEASDEGVTAHLTTTQAKVEVELAPRLGALALATPGGSEPPGGPLEAALCAARVSVYGGHRLDCAGHLTHWEVGAGAGASALRQLAVTADDGSLLLLASRRAQGAEAHDEEECASWLIDPEGHVSAFGESLLSTEYDGEGRQTRAGIELWPEEDEGPPLRGAGVALGGTAGARHGLTAALMRWAGDGRKGYGSYLVWRP